MTFINATFAENFTNTGGDGGGAHFSSGAEALFINSLFYGNLAADDGGAVYLAQPDTTAVLNNCTLSENFAAGRGGGIAGETSSYTTITNCILWGNTDGGVDVEEAQLRIVMPATVMVTYTCIEDLGTYAGSDNIGDDPLFVEILHDNYRLFEDSPCINTADNNAVDPDDFDVDEDTNYFEDTPDLDFGARIIDDIVDMGPYESVSCAWDLDGDCVVGAMDLMTLLRNWDDPYGAADLLALIAAWGPCQCDPNAVVLSLPEELADACLTPAEWDEYVDVMTDPDSSQADKDRYDCWMTHYIEDCNRCICIGASGCPNPDPFN